jgi:PAS domain S-box-containing protein
MEESDAFKTRKFLGHLIKGMAEGVIFIDDKNIVRVCNPIGARIRGVGKEGLLNKNFLSCHPSRTHKKVAHVVEELKSGQKKELKRTVRFKDGYYEHTYSAVRDEEGNYLGIVAVSRDITDRVNLERELKEHSEKLESSNRLKDLFSDIMRHDFINSASVISNFADLLLEDEPAEDIKTGLITINRNAEKLLEMIENASKFSKLEDEDALIYKETDVGKMLKSSIDEFQTFAKKREMTFDVELEGEHLAKVNPVLEDVFLNLISNAIKYSQQGSRITADIEDLGDGYLISVADQAERIPPEFRTSIFERFKRVGKGGVKGSGLGLAIVKRIVDLHKGKVWVEENPGGGNIFKVEIPKDH